MNATIFFVNSKDTAGILLFVFFYDFGCAVFVFNAKCSNQSLFFTCDALSLFIGIFIGILNRVLRSVNCLVITLFSHKHNVGYLSVTVEVNGKGFGEFRELIQRPGAVCRHFIGVFHVGIGEQLLVENKAGGGQKRGGRNVTGRKIGLAADRHTLECRLIPPGVGQINIRQVVENVQSHGFERIFEMDIPEYEYSETVS
mgnify:CR=1 FL=1